MNFSNNDNTVDLPEPDEPVIATHEPAGTLNVTPSNAYSRFPPACGYRTDTSRKPTSPTKPALTGTPPTWATTGCLIWIRVTGWSVTARKSIIRCKAPKHSAISITVPALPLIGVIISIIYMKNDTNCSTDKTPACTRTTAIHTTTNNVACTQIVTTGVIKACARSPRFDASRSSPLDLSKRRTANLSATKALNVNTESNALVTSATYAP